MNFSSAQEFRMQVQEMKDFIGDKKRLVREDSFKDGIGNIKVRIIAGPVHVWTDPDTAFENGPPESRLIEPVLCFWN